MILLFSWFTGWGLLAIPKRLESTQSWFRPMHYCRQVGQVGVFDFLKMISQVESSQRWNFEMETWTTSTNHSVSSLAKTCVYTIRSTSTAYTSSRISPHERSDRLENQPSNRQVPSIPPVFQSPSSPGSSVALCLRICCIVTSLGEDQFMMCL